ncbi:MAG: RMD1 family protein [Chitinophagia bacterium]|nr:RMD1 family protein [Chitinophagia bacterium]
MKVKAVSYQIAESIDLRAFRKAFPAEPAHEEPDELFYAVDEQRHLSVFQYGVVSMLDYDEVRSAELLRFMEPYCRNLLEPRLSEEILVDTASTRFRLGYNTIELTHCDPEVLRIILLNVSQSVALDHYSQLTAALLEETYQHTQALERKGRLDMSGTRMIRYIGRTLNLKNRISENLYIFDSPDVTWENETLNRVDVGLKRTFDLQVRFRNIRDELEIVKENLDLFKDLVQHRKSLMLEWIVIALILVEVLNLLLEKLL